MGCEQGVPPPPRGRPRNEAKQGGNWNQRGDKIGGNPVKVLSVLISGVQNRGAHEIRGNSVMSTFSHHRTSNPLYAATPLGMNLVWRGSTSPSRGRMLLFPIPDQKNAHFHTCVSLSTCPAQADLS